MKYAQIREFDVSNMDGIAATLFVSGCSHKCIGCFNREAQSFSFGEEFTKDIEDKFISICKNPLLDGINILGGEPLEQDVTLLNLLKRLHSEVKKPIWLWTGYTYDEILKDDFKLSIVKEVDVLIDGKFEIDKKDLSLKYRGSSN